MIAALAPRTAELRAAGRSYIKRPAASRRWEDGMRVSLAVSIALISSLAFAGSVGSNELGEIRKLADVTNNLPSNMRAEIIARKYRSQYPASNLADLDTVALRERYESADIAAFYSHDRGIALEMLAIHEIMRSRRESNLSDLIAAAGALVVTRSFNAARTLLSAEPLPELTIPDVEELVTDDNYRWQILRLGPKGLVRDIAAIDAGMRVVVVSNPLCGFSSAATKAIESDPYLSAFFSEYGLWLVPPAQRLYVDEVSFWKETYPAQEIVLAYQRTNWPVIDDWATPTFYFLKDGIVVDKISGWPKDGRNMVKLRAAVSSAIAIGDN